MFRTELVHIILKEQSSYKKILFDFEKQFSFNPTIYLNSLSQSGLMSAWFFCLISHYCNHEWSLLDLSLMHIDGWIQKFEKTYIVWKDLCSELFMVLISKWNTDSFDSSHDFCYIKWLLISWWMMSISFHYIILLKKKVLSFEKIKNKNKNISRAFID